MGRLDSERYTELNEQAQRQQEEINQTALDAVRKGLLPQSHPDFDGKHCVECGNLVPFKRLEMGRIRCVGCQNAQERSSQLFRR